MLGNSVSPHSGSYAECVYVYPFSLEGGTTFCEELWAFKKVCIVSQNFKRQRNYTIERSIYVSGKQTQYLQDSGIQLKKRNHYTLAQTLTDLVHCEYTHKLVGSTSHHDKKYLLISERVCTKHMSESEILGTFQNARIKCYFSPLFSTGYIKNGLRCL